GDAMAGGVLPGEDGLFQLPSDLLNQAGAPGWPEFRNLTTYRREPSKPNLLASLGDGQGPHLVINSHLDTFPAAAGPWRFPPYAGVVDDGRLYGCGSSDMRAGLAISLFLA